MSPASRPAKITSAALVLVVGSGLAAAALSSPAVAAEKPGYGKIDAPPSSVFADEKLTVTGAVANKFQRTIKLQAKSGSKFKTIATTKSKASGSFTFKNVKFSKTTTVRIVSDELSVLGSRTAAEIKKERTKAQRSLRSAEKSLSASQKKLRGAKTPKARKANQKKVNRAKVQVKSSRQYFLKFDALHKRKKNRVKYTESKPVTVTVEKQQVRISDLPGIVQAGVAAASPKNEALVSVGTAPARAGRSVALERRDGSKWVRVGTQRTDALGHAIFAAAPGKTYRAQVSGYAGLSTAPAVTTGATTVRDFKLDFEDAFSGTQLDTTKWREESRSLGNSLRDCSWAGPGLATVNNGVLRLGVAKDPKLAGKKCSYTDAKGVKHQLPYMQNSMISTTGKYTTRYGFIAARMKVQSAEGMHSGFWSNAPTHVPGRPDKGVEIDILEYYGEPASGYRWGLANAIHSVDAKGQNVKDGYTLTEPNKLIGNKEFSDSYHVYSVEWTPKEYIFRFDGREYNRVSKGISQVEQNLLLSNLTSDYELVNLTDANSAPLVDWVRTWQ